MLVEQRRWTAQSGWTVAHAPARKAPPQLVLFFGAREALAGGGAIAALRDSYPGALLLGCSTAGEICGTEVSDDSITATAIHLEQTVVRTASRPLTDPGQSGVTGELLARDLPHAGQAVRRIRMGRIRGGHRQHVPCVPSPHVGRPAATT